MCKYLTFIILSIIVIFFNMDSIQAQNAIIKKVIESEIDNNYRIGHISKLKKIGNKYVFIDGIANRVYVLKNDFSVDYVFDHEACHPGSPFRPLFLTKINDSTVLISSVPIYGYLFQPDSKNCSTKEMQNSRYRGAKYLASTSSGLMGLNYWPDETMQFYFWDNSLNLLETVTIKDDLPYINMRSRMISEEKLLFVNNSVMYLNEFDFTIMYLDYNTMKSNKISRRIMPIPIKNFNKARRDVTTNEQANPQSFANAVMGRSLVKAIRWLGEGDLMVEVSDLATKITHTFFCDVSLTNCSEIQYQKSGGTIYAGDGEIVNVKEGVNNPILIKYVITKN